MNTNDIAGQTRTTRLALAKVKVSRSQSQETVAFSADLLLDGRVIAHVDNDGRGGANRYYKPAGMTWEDHNDGMSNAHAIVSAMPKVTDADGFSYGMDLCGWCMCAADRENDEKRIARMMQRAVFFRLPGDDQNNLRKATNRGGKKMTDAERTRTEAWVLAHYPDATIVRSI